MAKPQSSLPGFYRLLFLYIEPVSTMIPSLIVWGMPGGHGARWFFSEALPEPDNVIASLPFGTREKLVIWQLVNCYMLLSLMSTIMFRTFLSLEIPQVSQEKLVGRMLAILAFADVTHVLASFYGLPTALRSDFLAWNGTTHGNITFTIFLFVVRMSWFFRVGRGSAVLGQSTKKTK